MESEVNVKVSDPVLGTSAPSRYWATGNVGESTPRPLSPLCWSLWGAGNEVAGLLGWHRFGMCGPDEIVADPDQNERMTGVFYGRVALNVDVVRKWYDRFPGMTADAFEMAMVGSLREDAAPTIQLSAVQENAVAEATEIARGTHGRRLAEMASEQYAWWLRDVLEPVDYVDPVIRLRNALDRFVVSLSIHAQTRLLSATATLTVHEIAGGVGAEHLVADVVSAFGGLEELSMADDLWKLAHGELEMSVFVARYGHNGDAVGNPTGTSWRQAPELLDGLMAGIRGRGESDHPARRAERAQERQQKAVSELEALLDDSQIRDLRAAIAHLADSTRELEVGKAAFLRAIDGYRAAARDLGRELVQEGRFVDPEDGFLFTIEEIEHDRGRSVDGDVLDERRANRLLYASYRLPETFYGFPEPEVLDPVRPDVGDVLEGVGASGALAEGTVKIVSGPDDYDHLESGDILVCEATDPSWTPLFLVVDAAIIDLGSASSHGAIIARELGLPAVLNVSGASRRLRNGDTVAVDGTKGTVTVLALADTP
jgi:phosphohistidine swiveling domain-containing protein